MHENIETNLVLDTLEKFKLLSTTTNLNYPPENNKLSEGINKIKSVIALLQNNWIQNAHGYFANARSKSEYATLDNEYKIQDLLYLQLLPEIPDLQYENPNNKNKGALTSTRIDFFSRKESLYIEAKLASSKHDAKKIESELSEDITKYGRDKNFKNLIFFIFCYNYSFPNKNEFIAGFSNSNKIDGHEFQTYCVIQP